MNMQVRVDGQGKVRFIYDEKLIERFKDKGKVSIKRASYVEPNEDGSWYVDLGPVKGPRVEGFKTRSDALAYEVEYLNVNGIPKVEG